MGRGGSNTRRSGHSTHRDVASPIDPENAECCDSRNREKYPKNSPISPPTRNIGDPIDLTERTRPARGPAISMECWRQAAPGATPRHAHSTRHRFDERQAIVESEPDCHSSSPAAHPIVVLHPRILHSPEGWVT